MTANSIGCLAANNVTLSYGTRTVLQDVSFDISPGEIVGVLGPNGAGKSSLFRVLMGLATPQTGRFSFEGKSISAGSPSLRAHVGIMFQDGGLDKHLSIESNLLLSAQLYALPKNVAQERITALLQWIGLNDRRKDSVQKLSGGTRRRVEMVRALLHQPRLLLLDEPTNGLDMHAFELFWDHLLLLRQQKNLAMMLSTHRADEAARCDKLLVLNEGRVVLFDRPQTMLSSFSAQILVLHAPLKILSDPQQLAEWKQQFMRIADVEKVWQREQSLCCNVPNHENELHHVLEQCKTLQPLAISLRPPSLADAFVCLTGQSLGYRLDQAI